MTGPETVFFPLDENFEPDDWRSDGPWHPVDRATEVFMLLVGAGCFFGLIAMAILRVCGIVVG